ncbi:unnamed protein product [Rotaria sp. Silwood2]|nr:unnamed protein product [Rotaria sp. Silwood2]CAF4481398.1 unnamed protein product [Rotaria sp. Silwood2]
MAAEKWGKFFQFSSLNNNRTNGLCKLCNKNLKDRHGVYSNFVKHLKRIHPREYEKFVGYEGEHLTEETNAINDEQADIEIKNTKHKQNQFILSLTKNLIIKCNLPLNIVEHTAFREFLKDCHLKFEPVSARKLKHAVIPSFTNNVRKIIQEALDNTNDLTLTIDGWSDRRCRSYLGVTCHLIDSKMSPQSYLIDFVRFKSPHTSENIRQLTEDILERFNIKEKVFKVITDNASSMIKAYNFGIFTSEEDDVYDHQMNSTLKEDPTFDQYDDHIELENFRGVDVYPAEDIEEYEDSSRFRLSCFLHTLQLCVRDGLKSASYMSKTLDKCRALAKVSHKSTKIADALEELTKCISKANITRWNSDFLLIKSILSIGKNDLDSIVMLLENPIKFSNNDIIILNELIDILEPFHEISVKCQSETIVTASLVVPAVVHLIVHLRDITENLSYCNKLVQQLKLSIEARFAGIINRLNQLDVEKNDPFNDPVYFMAAVLDPSFKFFWLRDLKLSPNMENRLKQNIIQLILDEVNKNLKLSPTKLSNKNTSASNPKKKKLFVYNEISNDVSNDPEANNPVVELEVYLNDPIRSKFSDYWSYSQLYHLKKLVRRICSVQASTAAIERVFSQAGLILSSRRTRMSEELFKDLVFLKVNKTLL